MCVLAAEPISKRLQEHEVESAHAHKQRLASTQASNKMCALVTELRADKQALKLKLEAEIRELREQLAAATRVRKVQARHQ